MLRGGKKIIRRFQMKSNRFETWSVECNSHENRCTDLKPDMEKRAQSLAQISRAASEKKIVAQPSFSHKVCVQIRYMEKKYLLCPVLLILLTLGVAKVAGLSNGFGMEAQIGIGMDAMKNTNLFVWISSAAAFCGVFGTISIGKIFAHHMGELESTFYYNISEIIVIRLILASVINGLLILSGSAVLWGATKWKFINILLYILTPYLLSNCVYLAILLQTKNRNIIFPIFAAGAICSCFWMIVMSRKMIYESSMLLVWVMLFFIACAILGAETYWLLHHSTKGEMTCYQ